MCTQILDESVKVIFFQQVDLDGRQEDGSHARPNAFYKRKNVRSYHSDSASLGIPININVVHV